MAHGPLVDDITLNDTILPNNANTIKIANTILVDSRVRRCLIELDTMVDDGADTTVGTVLDSLSDAEDNINALTEDKADATTVNAMALTLNTLQTSFDNHDQDENERRHINTQNGVDGQYLAFDSTMASGTNNIWKTLPIQAASPIRDTLTKEVLSVPAHSVGYTLPYGKDYVFNMGFIPDAGPCGTISCSLQSALLEEADIGSYTYVSVERLPPNCPFVIQQEPGIYTGAGLGSGLNVRTVFDNAHSVEALFKNTSGVVGLRFVDVSLDSPGLTGRPDARVLRFDVVEGDVCSAHDWISNNGTSKLLVHPYHTNGILTLTYPEFSNGSYIERQEYTPFSTFMNMQHDSPLSIPNHSVYMADGANGFAFKEVYSPENPPPGGNAPAMIFELKTSDFTAEDNHFYQVNASGPLNITMPAAPVQGDPPIMFRIKGASATNVITFMRNSENIEEIADDGYITGNGTIKAMFAGAVGGVNVGWTLAEGQTY